MSGNCIYDGVADKAWRNVFPRDKAKALDDDANAVSDFYSLMDDFFIQLAKGSNAIFNQMPYKTRKQVSAFPNVEASGPGIPDLPRVSYGGRI